MRLVWPALCLTLLSCASAHAFTKSGTTYTTDGSQPDVNAAIANATAGDSVNIPAGTFTWGTGALRTYIDKAITLSGAGQGATVINIASDISSSNGLITLMAAATVRNFSINTPGKRAFDVNTTSSGWRVSQITYVSTSGNPYFLFGGSMTGIGYGLIDQCDITGSAGNQELIFTRGSSDSWQTPHSIGAANNLFIEDCIFRGSGYVCDANANARYVVRNCTITGPIKVDGHGIASNSPARGVRHMEVYNNAWTARDNYYAAIELRGGTGMVFGNTLPNNIASRAWFYLTDYGYTGLWPNFGNQYQTPADYPVKDQIGVGPDPKSAASEPMYLWSNTASNGQWTLTWKAIPQGAIDRYRAQTGDAAATFTMQDVIKADRDYFNQVSPFTGASGVGVGTKAQMLAITATKTGVGFWVTDEGSWDTTKAANTSGQLYRWTGSAWALHYTPYTYPHPARRPGVPSNVRIRQG